MNSRTLQPQSWWLSLGGHALVAGAFLLTLVPKSKPVEQVPIDVIEAPVTAPLTIRKAPPPKEQEKPQNKPRAVFGVSRKALTSEDGPVVKAGNTVAKAPDQEKLRPEDEDALPIPTEEYLVSSMPELLADFRVPYPPEAKKKGVEGAVVMDLLIDAQGSVREARLVEGRGSGLDEAALEAAKRLKFKPARVEDKPVAVRIRYAYRFVLEK